MKAAQRLVYDLRKLILEHYTTMHFPSQYAAALFVSENHLNRICKNSIGKTVGELIRNQIVIEAEKLLQTQTLSVGEIAISLGFDNISYFTSFFKRYHNQSPLEYRTTVKFQ